MNLLRKYYDKDSIGGGIPDEVRQKIEKYVDDNYLFFTKEVIRAIKVCSYSVYNNFALPELKTKDEEISRLKEENERLRGEVELLNGSIQQLLFDISKGRL